MKVNEWHWARLKNDILIDDADMLRLLECESFILPANTIVWARRRWSFIDITTNPELLALHCQAFQYIFETDISYPSLLEPLE